MISLKQTKLRWGRRQKVPSSNRVEGNTNDHDSKTLYIPEFLVTFWCKTLYAIPRFCSRLGT